MNLRLGMFLRHVIRARRSYSSVSPHVNDGAASLPLSSSIRLGALAFVPRPDVSPRHRRTSVFIFITFLMVFIHFYVVLLWLCNLILVWFMHLLRVGCVPLSQDSHITAFAFSPRTQCMLSFPFCF